MSLDLLEEYLLIALDDSKGQFVIDSTHLHYGFAGAILLELALREKVSISGEYVKVNDSSAVTEIALNKALEYIEEKAKSKKVKDVINGLAKQANELKQDVLQRLINKGILKKEEHKILWIIPNNKYPASDMTPENKVRERIKAVMLYGAKSEPRDIMLLSLIDVSDLTREAFRDKEDYKKVKKKIKEVTQDVKISGAINKSIREIQAAIMITIMASVVVTTTITSN
ncbi:GPP34 family phosphoprotein [Roseivirga sp. E12]|uniref:GOLPH3/VPS74 family protein n=1 Tax=Roseivirga sp. E12 TaxID=2819237 RepID=UPI001ABC17D9|nr:GPP34 family phosphoprotein [Roseivirga sp. E12]MBO3697108.1 GPP34 family phosphoprotein [Roseivirga sp. E12]